MLRVLKVICIHKSQKSGSSNFHRTFEKLQESVRAFFKLELRMGASELRRYSKRESAFVRSFVCSFVRSFVRLLVRSFVRSLARSFIRLFVRMLFRWFVLSLSLFHFIVFFLSLVRLCSSLLAFCFGALRVIPGGNQVDGLPLASSIALYRSL